MKEKFKKIKQWLKTTKARIVLLVVVLAITVGIIFNFTYIFPILILALMFYFIKQAEKENDDINRSIAEEDLEEQRDREIRKLEKTIDVIRDHLEKNEDLDAKLRLVELEERLKELKRN